ncbi:MAG TPA: hydroxymethylbilane synthase [Thermomicrobiales bacterium]|nr:hydroxymethylbilane synthase [Thermomicrobiales bacterium]
MIAAVDALRFGSRGSALALRQTERVIGRVAGRWPDADNEIVVIRTAGDIDKTTPLTVIGGQGVFTSALEAALLANQIDAAVHSAKDLPSETPPGLALVAFPERAAPEDVLVSRHGAPLAALPANPVIGTSSRRRALQIALARPDARIVQIRGNLDTRLHKALTADFDGVVLAAAGIDRMGWQDRITQRLPLDRFIPVPGQGALAVEIRAADERTRALLAPLDDPAVGIPVRIERAFLRALGAGCLTPVGAYVERGDGGLRLRAMLGDDAGAVVWVDESLDPGEPEAHAAAIARRLQADLAGAAARSSLAMALAANGASDDATLAGLRVLATRPADRAGELIDALRAAGAEPIAYPLTRIDDPDDWAPVDRALAALANGEYDWVVFTSANAVTRLAERAAASAIAPWPERTKTAAVGAATARALAAAGIPVDLRPDQPDAAGVVAALRRTGVAGARVLFPHGDLASDTIAEGLTAAGATVDAAIFYRTAPEPEPPAEARERLLAGAVDALTFASPSSARRLAADLGPAFPAVAALPTICVGPATADAARSLGYNVAAVAAEPSAAGIVAALAAWRRGRRKPDAAKIKGRDEPEADGKGA